MDALKIMWYNYSLKYRKKISGLRPDGKLQHKKARFVFRAFVKDRIYGKMAWKNQSTIILFISLMKLSALSLWTSTLMGFERSRLKIPIMDFASTIYRPDERSTSKSYLLTMLTKSFTSFMDFSRILNVFICLSHRP